MDDMKTIFVVLSIFIIVAVIFPLIHTSSAPIAKNKHHNVASEHERIPDSKRDPRECGDDIIVPPSPYLDSYFPDKPAPSVPIDYPLKQIGECPYSKPQSKELPVANVLMCFADKSKDMKLA